MLLSTKSGFSSVDHKQYSPSSIANNFTNATEKSVLRVTPSVVRDWSFRLGITTPNLENCTGINLDSVSLHERMRRTNVLTCCGVKPELQERHTHRWIQWALRAYLPRQKRERPQQARPRPAAPRQSRGRNDDFPSWREGRWSHNSWWRSFPPTLGDTAVEGGAPFLGALVSRRDFPSRHFTVPPRPPHPRLESRGQARSPFRAPGAAVLPVIPTAQRLEGTLPLPFSSRSHALHHVAQHSLPGQRAQPREISDWSATRDFGWRKGKARRMWWTSCRGVGVKGHPEGREGREQGAGGNF